MFIRVFDETNEHIKYLNINYIISVCKLRTNETSITYMNGHCYTYKTPEEILEEIERVKNEENE